MANCWFCYKDCGKNEYHTRCSKKFFGTEIVPELLLNKKLLKELAEKTVNQRIAVTGVQPKLSVTLEHNEHNRLTIVGLWEEYILKPQHTHYAAMPETEDLTMHLASLFKTDVCEHALIKASDKSLVYLAKRFDRNNGKKIHIEDLCQLSEFLTENKYKGAYEKAGKLVQKYCNPGIDVLNYFELVLFSYLSGNNDMHLKKISLMHTDNGIVFCPAYDLLNVNLISPADDEELALTLNGKKKKIKLEDFISLAKALNISEKVYQNSFKKFTLKNKEVRDLIDRSFLSAESKKIYKATWLKNKKYLFIDLIPHYDSQSNTKRF